MSSHVLTTFEALPQKDKITVAIAVLLDGHDAADFLDAVDKRTVQLRRAALELVALPPELRLPLVGTFLREECRALEERLG